jgi:hypothetical protein
LKPDGSVAILDSCHEITPDAIVGQQQIPRLRETFTRAVLILFGMTDIFEGCQQPDFSVTANS